MPPKKSKQKGKTKRNRSPTKASASAAPNARLDQHHRPISANDRDKKTQRNEDEAEEVMSPLLDRLTVASGELEDQHSAPAFSPSIADANLAGSVGFATSNSGAASDAPTSSFDSAASDALATSPFEEEDEGASATSTSDDDESNSIFSDTSWDNENEEAHSLVMMENPIDEYGSNLEKELDEADDDDKISKISVLTRRLFDQEGGKYDLRGGGFEKYYNKVRDADIDELEGLDKAIALLVHCAETTHPSKFSSDQDMVDAFEKERTSIWQALKAALTESGNEDLIEEINLGDGFSTGILVLIYLHYAPKGCRPSDNDQKNHCRPDQTCIRAVKSKVPNFLINEQEHGARQMEEWTFGGRTNVDVGSRIATLDMIPFLLEKKSSAREMIEQYADLAKKCGLDSFYALMVIPYCFVKMHVLLFEKQHINEENGQKKLEILVASSFTSKQIFGESGLERYLHRTEGTFFGQVNGLHPEAMMRGAAKNNVVYTDDILEVMNDNLVQVYRDVCGLKLDFQSKLLNIFGVECSCIDIGMYNRLAKVLAALDLLDLDKRVATSMEDGNGDEVQCITAILEENGIHEDWLNFFLGELKAVKLSRLMDRVMNCRANQENIGMYNRLAKVLAVMGLLDLDKRVATSMKEGNGDEVQCITAILEENGICEDWLNFILGELKDKTLSQLMDRVRRYRAIHRMGVVASQIPDGATEFRMLPDEMKSMIEALSNALGQTSTIIFDKLLKLKDTHAKSGKRVKLRNHLAGVYNDNGGAEGNGLSAIKVDPEFQEYVDICGQNEEVAITRIQFTSEAYDATFWKHCDKLKKYRDSNPNDTVEVDGVSVLTVRKQKDGALYGWLSAMNGYQDNFDFREAEYGIKAYKQPGSIEYLSLLGLNVSFNVDEHTAAMKQRVRNDETSTEVGFNRASFMRMGASDSW